MGAPVLLAALVLALPQESSLPVSRGERLRVETREGSVTVRVWERDEVRVSGRDVSLRRDGDGVRVDDPRGLRERRRDAIVDVPAWLDVEISGHEVDVEVEGVAGRVWIRTVDGDVRLTGTTGEVDAHTVDGQLVARDLSGRTSLSTLDGHVEVVGVRGRLSVESTDGDLWLSDVDAEEVDAETLDGDVTFDGRIPAGSRVRLATHDGDVRVTIPEDTRADLSVSTFDGAFDPGFPVRALSLRSGQPASFQLGEGGGATLELRAFDGDIVLRRRGG